MGGFTARLRQHYKLGELDLFVLDETYDGDIGPGDHVEVDLAEGGAHRVRIHDLAWGSALTATSPPLTLIVAELAGREPAPGAAIRSV